jgi:hypothetical protein
MPLRCEAWRDAQRDLCARAQFVCAACALRISIGADGVRGHVRCTLTRSAEGSERFARAQI